jgi:hypothetical protein
MAGALFGFRALYYHYAASALAGLLLAVLLGAAVYLLMLGLAFRPVLAEGWRLWSQAWQEFLQSRRVQLAVLPKEG